MGRHTVTDADDGLDPVDPGQMLSAAYYERFAAKGRMVTKVVLIIETVGCDDASEGGREAALHFRRSDDCPSWSANGMLAWAQDGNDEDLFAPDHE